MNNLKKVILAENMKVDEGILRKYRLRFVEITIPGSGRVLIIDSKCLHSD